MNGQGKAPIVSWYEGTLNVKDEVKKTVDYGVVDAATESKEKTFYIFNNRNGKETVAPMEGVAYTTVDTTGGGGTDPVLDLVRDKWMNVKCDSLSESLYVQVGGEQIHPLGTTGSTQHRGYSEAYEWSASQERKKGEYVKPTSHVSDEKKFFYIVTQEGTTGGIEPSWSKEEGGETTDGTVRYTTLLVRKSPEKNSLLGIANIVDDDGSNAETNASGNYTQITTKLVVPQMASSGRQDFLQRVSFKFS